jgi:lactoylglutathione lyase
MVKIASLVVFAADADKSAHFYSCLGVELEAETHGDGPIHMATDIDGVHFAILQSDSADGRSSAFREPGSDFPGFYVESLDDTTASLLALGVNLLIEHQVKPWGCRVVAEDPDGRAVEVNQRSHCPSDNA